MGKAEKGTAKYLANAMKSKGLQKLKWYCQVCEKQCRDDNGFKCHIMSEGHLRQMLVVGENAGKHINDYSSQFKATFISLLSRRWGTKRVKANTVYQEYIQDKAHLHMNATRWASLTEFCKSMGRAGIFRVDENEKGLFISWVDNSPATLAKSAAVQLKERTDMDDEERQRKYINEQIERAKALQAAQGPTTPARSESEEKPKEPKGPIVISFAKPPPAAAAPEPDVAVKVEEDAPAAPPATAIKLGAAPAAAPAVTPLAPAALQTNPLKKANPLKANALKASQDKDKKDAKPTTQHSLSAVEQLMLEDQERKRRRGERGGDRLPDSKRIKV